MIDREVLVAGAAAWMRARGVDPGTSDAAASDLVDLDPGSPLLVAIVAAVEADRSRPVARESG